MSTGCTALPGRGTDRVCTPAPTSPQDTTRSYTRVTRPDGSLVVQLTYLEQ